MRMLECYQGGCVLGDPFDYKVLDKQNFSPLFGSSTKAYSALNTTRGIITNLFMDNSLSFIANKLINKKPIIVSQDTFHSEANTKHLNKKNLFEYKINVLDMDNNSYSSNSNLRYDSELKLVGGIIMSDMMTKNLSKIIEYSKLELDWNGYGAKAFTSELLTLCKNIILHMTVQPKVFPTGRQSVQFEYEEDNGKYLELEVFESHTEVFSIDENGNEEEHNIENKYDEINKVVSSFYGRKN